jgi:hypothetical protein
MTRNLTKHQPLNNASGSTELGCGHEFITWGGGSGAGDASQYLWTDLRRPIRRLGQLPGGARVEANGDYFAWSVPATSGPVFALSVARVR